MKNLIWLFVCVVAFGTNLSAQRNLNPGKLVKEEVNQVVNAEKAQTLIYNNADIVILDVRTFEEYKGGSIKEAVNVPYDETSFTSKLNDLDKSKTYLVYCRSGVRSQKAAEVMKANGFNYLYQLEAGYNAWPHKAVD